MAVHNDVVAALAGGVGDHRAAERVDVRRQVALGEWPRRTDRQPHQAAHRGDHLLGGCQRVITTDEDVGGDAGLGQALAETADGQVAAPVLTAPQGTERGGVHADHRNRPEVVAHATSLPGGLGSEPGCYRGRHGGFGPWPRSQRRRTTPRKRREPRRSRTGTSGRSSPASIPAGRSGASRLPDGTEWKYREPNATVIVEHEKLRVRANPLSRSHDRIQVLDNAKHMYFSTARFTPPDDGTISVELSIAARRHNGVAGDLYDGMATVNLLDFDTGAAIDFFATNDKLATVYGRVLFPGVVAEPPADLNRPTYFCIFNEVPVATRPGPDAPLQDHLRQGERPALVVHRRRGGRPSPRGALQDEQLPGCAGTDDREADRRRPQHQPARAGSHRRVEPAHHHPRAPPAGPGPVSTRPDELSVSA